MDRPRSFKVFVDETTMRSPQKSSSTAFRTVNGSPFNSPRKTFSDRVPFQNIANSPLKRNNSKSPSRKTTNLNSIHTNSPLKRTNSRSPPRTPKKTTNVNSFNTKNSFFNENSASPSRNSSSSHFLQSAGFDNHAFQVHKNEVNNDLDSKRKRKSESGDHEENASSSSEASPSKSRRVKKRRSENFGRSPRKAFSLAGPSRGAGSVPFSPNKSNLSPALHAPRPKLTPHHHRQEEEKPSLPFDHSRTQEKLLTSPCGFSRAQVELNTSQAAHEEIASPLLRPKEEIQSQDETAPVAHQKDVPARPQPKPGQRAGRSLWRPYEEAAESSSSVVPSTSGVLPAAHNRVQTSTATSYQPTQTSFHSALLELAALSLPGSQRADLSLAGGLTPYSSPTPYSPASAFGRPHNPFMSCISPWSNLPFPNLVPYNTVLSPYLLSSPRHLAAATAASPFAQYGSTYPGQDPIQFGRQTPPGYGYSMAGQPSSAVDRTSPMLRSEQALDLCSQRNKTPRSRHSSGSKKKPAALSSHVSAIKQERLFSIKQNNLSAMKQEHLSAMTTPKSAVNKCSTNARAAVDFVADFGLSNGVGSSGRNINSSRLDNSINSNDSADCSSSFRVVGVVRNEAGTLHPTVPYHGQTETVPAAFDGVEMKACGVGALVDMAIHGQALAGRAPSTPSNVQTRTEHKERGQQPTQLSLSPEEARSLWRTLADSVNASLASKGKGNSHVGINPTALETLERFERDPEFRGQKLTLYKQGMVLLDPYKTANIYDQVVHSPNADKPFSANINGVWRQYKTRRSVNRALKRDIEKYICIFCESGNRKGDSYDIQRHLRTHTCTMPFKCGVAGCSYAHSQKVSVVNHLKSHHKETMARIDQITKEIREKITTLKQQKEESSTTTTTSSTTTTSPSATTTSSAPTSQKKQKAKKSRKADDDEEESDEVELDEETLQAVYSIIPEDLRWFSFVGIKDHICELCGTMYRKASEYIDHLEKEHSDHPHLLMRNDRRTFPTNSPTVPATTSSTTGGDMKSEKH